MRTTTIAPILAVLLVGACGVGPAPTATPTGSPGASPAQSGPPSSSPSPTAGADVAVIRIAQVGGMMPPWISVNWYPSVVVYADGRLIMQGPQIEIYPGPALPNLQVTQLTAHAIEQLLEWASDAGLSGPDRTIGQPILDAGATVFTIDAPTGRHQTTLLGQNGDPAVGAALQFQDLMLSAGQWLNPADVIGDDQAYAWQRMQIVVAPADPGLAPDPQLATLRDWPLAPLSTGGREIEPGQGYRCAVIDGADADTLRAAVGGANELTLWISADDAFQVTFHPLLPDEPGCAGA